MHWTNGIDFQDYLGAKAAGLQAIMVDRYYHNKPVIDIR